MVFAVQPLRLHNDCIVAPEQDGSIPPGNGSLHARVVPVACLQARKPVPSVGRDYRSHWYMVSSNFVYRGDSVKDQQDRGSKFKDFGPPRGINLPRNHSQLGGSVLRTKYHSVGSHTPSIVLSYIAIFLHDVSKYLSLVKYYNFAKRSSSIAQIRIIHCVILETFVSRLTLLSTMTILDTYYSKCSLSELRTNWSTFQSVKIRTSCIFKIVFTKI